MLSNKIWASDLYRTYWCTNSVCVCGKLNNFLGLESLNCNATKVIINTFACLAVFSSCCLIAFYCFTSTECTTSAAVFKYNVAVLITYYVV